MDGKCYFYWWASEGLSLVEVPRRPARASHQRASIYTAQADLRRFAQRLVKVLEVEDGGILVGGDEVQSFARIESAGLGHSVIAEQSFREAPGPNGQSCGRVQRPADLAQHLCRAALNRLSFCRIVHKRIARVVSLCSTPSADLRCLGSDDSGRGSTGHAAGPGAMRRTHPRQRMNPNGCVATLAGVAGSLKRS